jgi:phage terminase large subunit
MIATTPSTYTLKASPIFRLCQRAKRPIVVHSGGTSSGKTYSIIQYLFTLAVSTPNLVITVAGQDIPNLKVGAYRDAQAIIADTPPFAQRLTMHNKSERSFTFQSGSVVEFNSYSDAQDAKSGKRHYLFVNEANGVPYEIFEELQIRTSVRTFLDFNPTASFWAHERLLPRDDVAWHNTTYRDNPFINPSIREKIMAYEPTPENIKRGTANEYRWKVYGMGEVGRLEGLVFPDFKVTNDWPDEYKWKSFGMDFGFTNDPTTLIEVRHAHGALYWREHLYRTGMTNSDISDYLVQIGHDVNDKITADSAEPKSIEELRRSGWFVRPAVKGSDSVNAGIDKIRRYPIMVYAQSRNLIEEFGSYTWALDRNGNATNKPIDRYNHGIDAGRYAVEDRTNQNDFIFT